jgi:hypothetical protein
MGILTKGDRGYEQKENWLLGRRTSHWHCDVSWNCFMWFFKFIFIKWQCDFLRCGLMMNDSILTKRLYMIKILMLSLLGICNWNMAFAADTGLSPSSVKITVYAVAISQNADCSAATSVATYPSGKVFDFMANPAVFTGNISAGTYPCIILKMSDQVTFTPATTSTSGHCVAGTAVTTPVCNSGGGQKFQTMTINADSTVTIGAAATCTAANGNSGEAVPLFLSTGSTGVTGSIVPFVQPNTASASNCTGGVGTGCGIKLNTAFTVSGTASGTFVVNFNGQVQDGGGLCGLNAPVFSFR